MRKSIPAGVRLLLLCLARPPGNEIVAACHEETPGLAAGANASPKVQESSREEIL